eukprot:scaffold4510_cov183-Amphora_coffeaeformis.AAC.28
MLFNRHQCQCNTKGHSCAAIRTKRTFTLVRPYVCRRKSLAETAEFLISTFFWGKTGESNVFWGSANTRPPMACPSG